MSDAPFTTDDLDQLRERGIEPAEAQRQLSLLRTPPPRRALARPCTVGDGIVRIAEDEREALALLHEQAARQGRVLKFVPASGAATRMFQTLIATRSRASALTGSRLYDEAEAGDPAAREVARLLDSVDRFPFADDLRAEVAFAGHDLDILVNSGNWGEVAAALLDREGLGYAELAKGLIAFHRYGTTIRTAFEEHLVEASAYARDDDGTARLHLTVSPEHLEGFKERFAEVEGTYARDLGVRFDLSFSVQKSSTDTIAISPDGSPFRDDAGRLLIRPSGHGALLENVNDLAADILLVKNIDNVVPDRQKGPTFAWKRILGGYLVALQREIFLHVARVRATEPEPWALEEAERFVRERLGLAGASAPDGATLIDRSRALLRVLERPIRVCGVVENRGEPGGGPYWVRLPDGSVAPQIVESAEVDLTDPATAEIFRSATHFNPVDLACGVRDVEGRAIDLRRFVDESAAIVATKSAFGRDLRALERPGLWNGAMALWTTVFVEVPIETFAPVKTLFDLLRPEHQP